MGNYQDDYENENAGIYLEQARVSNGFTWLRIASKGGIGLTLRGSENFAESKVEEAHGQNHPDPGDRAGIGGKVKEGVAEGSTNDYIGRVAGHSGTTTNIGSENLGDYYGDRVKLKQASQLNSYGSQE